MTNRAIGLIAAVTAAVALLCAAAPAVLLGGIAAACTAAPGTPSGTNAADRWDADQIANAATMVAVGVQRGVPPRGWVIAVATAMQESSLRNLPSGDRDSVGLFQQRPSQGWGTIDQLQDPTYATSKFYERLLTTPDWQTMALTDAAQAVQRPAFPDAYAKWEDDATALVQQAFAASGATTPGDVEWCLHAGWTQPVRAPIVSGFRTPERPDHDGVDLAAPADTPIRAAATGQVITARCDTDPSGQLCNRRGSPSTPGCGWYVKIRHPNNLVTMYCHMVRAPIVEVGQTVAVGQEIGQVGSSGHSSGDHLHFETQHPGEGPIDPVPYMREHGAPLGQA
jgi:murein DD-endopeptidase MepM/ murein hydrolase activator NlpD